MTVRRAVVTLAAAMAGPVVSAAEVVEIAWSPEQRFEHRVEVAPSKFAEVCGRLAQGAAVRWRFEAGAPLDFNIHYHVGKEVHYPARQVATAGAEGTLDPTRDQDYCWMWTNRGAAPATLELRLERLAQRPRRRP